MFAKQKGKWRPNLQVQMLSPGLEVNDVGLLQRTDAVSTHAVMHYLNTDQTKYTREISAWVGKYQNWNFDRDLTANGAGFNIFVQLKNYWAVYMWGGGKTDFIDDRMTRGGPAMIIRGDRYAGGGFESDTRKKFSLAFETERADDDFGGTFNMYWATFTYRPTPAIRISLTPSFRRLHEVAQYVSEVEDENYDATYGKRYIFATLDQRTLDIGVRTEWTVNARLSAQLYLQPFIASGDYT